MEKDKNLFRLSDSAKCDLIFDALNSTPDDYKIVCEIYDDYAIAYDAQNGKYIRAYYTKDNEANTIAIDRIEDCYIVDVTEAEMTALNAMKAMGSFTEIQTKLTEQDEQIATFTANEASLTQQLEEANAKIAEYENASATEPTEPTEPSVNNSTEGEPSEGEPTEGANEPEVNNSTEPVEGEGEKVDFAAQIEELNKTLAEKEDEINRLNNSISDLNNEKSELENFKKNVDTQKKQEIIAEFQTHLTEEQITDFTAKMDTYSVEDFKKEVCFAAYNSDTTMFSKKTEQGADLIYKDNNSTRESGVIALLNKHIGGNR